MPFFLALAPAFTAIGLGSVGSPLLEIRGRVCQWGEV
jgi:hypothetical protein